MIGGNFSADLIYVSSLTQSKLSHSSVGDVVKGNAKDPSQEKFFDVALDFPEFLKLNLLGKQ